MFTRAREKNVRFNRNKIQLRVQHCKYIGHLLTPEGSRADPNKVKAISDMGSPTDAQELHRLQGMVRAMVRRVEIRSASRRSHCSFAPVDAQRHALDLDNTTRAVLQRHQASCHFSSSAALLRPIQASDDSNRRQLDRPWIVLAPRWQTSRICLTSHEH